MHLLLLLAYTNSFQNHWLLLQIFLICTLIVYYFFRSIQVLYAFVYEIERMELKNGHLLYKWLEIAKKKWYNWFFLFLLSRINFILFTFFLSRESKFFTSISHLLFGLVFLRVAWTFYFQQEKQWTKHSTKNF